MREWNGVGPLAQLAIGREGCTWDICVGVPRVPSYASADKARLPTNRVEKMLFLVSFFDHAGPEASQLC